MRLIMLCGVIGSGKDYHAQEYIRTHPEERVKIIRFATPLRNICAKLFNFDANDEGAYEKFKSENRKTMVDLGQAMKDEMGQSLFADAVRDYISTYTEEYRDDVTFIIPDFRFPVEFYPMFDFAPIVIFCNYKSERYEIRPEQVTEQMAIWLVEQGYVNNQTFSTMEFQKIMQKYQNSL